MAPRKKFGYTVAVFDSNSSPEFKEQATEVYKKINELKFLQASRDETKLYLANTLNSKYPSKKAFQASETAFFHPTNHKKLLGVTGTQGNILEALEMAVDDLSMCNDGTYASLQLVVFSDFATEPGVNPNVIIKNLTSKLAEMNAFVYFFGLDLPIGGALDTKKSVYECMKNTKVEFDSKLVIPSEICKETCAIMCPFELSVDLFFSYSRSAKGYPFLEPLDIGGAQIPTSCVKLLDKKPQVRPKVANPEPIDKTFVLADQQDETVDFGEVKYGLALHEKFVFIPADVNKAVKNYPRFFKLLGFTDAKNIPGHYLLPAANLVTVNESKDVRGYVNYLVEAANKFGKYGIALKAHMKGCRPKLYALIPYVNPHYFVMKELPYAEDFQILYNETRNPKIDDKNNDLVKTEGDLEEKLFDFLDSIDIDDKLVLHPTLRVRDCAKRQASQLGEKCNGGRITHEDEGILGLTFDDAVVLGKLADVTIHVDAGKQVEAAVEEETDPW